MQVKKTTYSKTITDAAFSMANFTQGWITNDGPADVTLIFFNSLDELILKPGEIQKWQWDNGNIMLGCYGVATGTTVRFCYVN